MWGVFEVPDGLPNISLDWAYEGYRIWSKQLRAYPTDPARPRKHEEDLAYLLETFVEERNLHPDWYARLNGFRETRHPKGNFFFSSGGCDLKHSTSPAFHHTCPAPSSGAGDRFRPDTSTMDVIPGATSHSDCKD